MNKFILSFLFLLCSFVPTLGQAPTVDKCRITDYAILPTGAPDTAATIKLLAYSKDGVTFLMSTNSVDITADSNGKFEFDLVRGAQVTLRATIRGLNPFGNGTVTVQVPDSATSSFYGLVTTTAIPTSGLTVKDEGTALTGKYGTLNFVGSGVATSNVGGVATITISGTSGAVDSVFGRTGVVVAATNDYSFSQISGSVADGQLSSNIPLKNGSNIFTAIQTITPAANTRGLYINSHSLTGSNTAAILELASTWNTSGAAQGILVNITNTSSGGQSRLIDLRVDSSSRFRVNTGGDGVFAGDLSAANLSGNNTGDQDLSTLLAKANNLSDLSNPSTARSNLGLAIGSNVQAFDSDLSAIAGLSPTNDDVIQRKSGAWTNRTMSQLKSDLALVKGDVGLGNVLNVDTTTTQNISDFTNKRFVTDAQLVVIGNTSGTNTGDQTISDATISTTDITTNNATTLKHGFLPKLSGSSSDVLRGDGTFGSISAGADTALSNLASVAINTSLISDTDNTDDLGSSSIAWRSIYIDTSIFLDTINLTGSGSKLSVKATSGGTPMSMETGPQRIYWANTGFGGANYFFLNPGNDGYFAIYEPTAPNIRFTRTANADNAHDAGISSPAAGRIKITNGSTGSGILGLGSGFAFSALPASPVNGDLVYCTDCTVTSGSDNTATSGGSGALLVRVNGVWRAFATQN